MNANEKMRMVCSSKVFAELKETETETIEGGALLLAAAAGVSFMALTNPLYAAALVYTASRIP